MSGMRFNRKWDFDDPNTLITRDDLFNPDSDLKEAFLALLQQLDFVPNPGGGGGDTGTLSIAIDTDGVPYFSLGTGTSSVSLDTDSVPYYLTGPGDHHVLADTDGTPYIEIGA